ncbi:MAG TPA: acylphosphatase [Phycisphaerales bacterium]|nr:acylphosphatase [Phycisphaerales bacterium]
MNGRSIRSEVVYAGRVQGVGFRATTLTLARQFAVVGFVRNEADGSVRLVAEGEAGEVERLLAEVRTRLGRFIQGERRSDHPCTGEFETFDIQR